MSGKSLTAAIAGLAILPSLGLGGQSRVTFYGDGRPSRMFHTTSGLNATDANFLRNAAVVSMFELESGKIAQERGTSDFTKQFGTEMVGDHTMSFDELKQVCAQKGVSLPSDLPQDKQRTINHLASLSGPDFDAAYRQAQMNGHAMASELFKKEIDNGRDEDVKSYAVKTLPEVTLHYKLAQIQRTMMGPTKADHGN